MNYKVNIFCLTAEYHKQLPSEFLNLGYIVSPSWTDGRFTAKYGIVAIISYSLSSIENKSDNDVCKDIKLAFNNIKGYFYGATCNTQVMFGNIKGETDPSRVLQIKALW